MEAWRNEWAMSTPCNGHIIDVPTSRLAGFDLNRSQWTTVNRIRTLRGRSGETLYKWGSRADASCVCGATVQSIEHIVMNCLLTLYNGDIADIYNCTDGALQWMDNLDLKL